MATGEQQKIALLDEKPAPVIWQTGDVVAVGSATMLRTLDGSWACTCGALHTDPQVCADLTDGLVTHLVRDRKPVQP